jgi:hypothetical protein
MSFTVNINNAPTDVDPYVVCRVLDGQLWYWGSWSDPDKANAAAAEMDGVVVCVKVE